MYLELMHWVHVQQFDIVLIQSTLWSLEEPWTTFGFMAVPSADSTGQKGGDLLTLVNHNFCKMESISYSSPRPGRVQLVRCHLSGGNIDVINCYQYMNSVTRTRQDPQKMRQLFWTDWNDTLRCPRYPSGGLLQIMTELIFKIWYIDGPYVPSPTFIGSQGSPNIDYIFMRRPQADQQGSLPAPRPPDHGCGGSHSTTSSTLSTVF